MPRSARDRDVERVRLRVAADRLLAGTPLHSASGRPLIFRAPLMMEAGGTSWLPPS